MARKLPPPEKSSETPKINTEKLFNTAHLLFGAVKSTENFLALKYQQKIEPWVVTRYELRFLYANPEIGVWVLGRVEWIWIRSWSWSSLSLSSDWGWITIRAYALWVSLGREQRMSWEIVIPRAAEQGLFLVHAHELFLHIISSWNTQEPLCCV